jgi:hypothetical protein
MEHYRSVSFDQSGEGELGRLSARRKSFQELAVGHIPDRPEAEQRSERREDRVSSPGGHGHESAKVGDQPSDPRITPRRGTIVPSFFPDRP